MMRTSLHTSGVRCVGRSALYGRLSIDDNAPSLDF